MKMENAETCSILVISFNCENFTNKRCAPDKLVYYKETQSRL